MGVELRLAFLGGATIYQAGLKCEVTATLFAEEDQGRESFFGHYDSATSGHLLDGPALVRFSDGSEAEAALATVDPYRGGFRLTGDRRELTQNE